ncbi:hypothetical protein SEVIR_7G250200v4 [Setaria viridis]|uniref:GIR1-like zinc ribbon domain-containing protein n=2 Tax=Setaria TaxID=4554 RepID=K3YEB4_SETIT|nr:uncharacterized protein LOC101756023 [Setaria italica]XP_034602500.1 uncharacterized protein LOC117863033 [Setaria viridis]RCV35424.1 hypothetical protein SETIT_7G238700v2 [Setaria italica]TKW06596.1 hypothetical protein SEVIR_7G250200v2 [Setaria viridis]
MAADVGSVARLLRGEAGKKAGPPEIVTMDLLGGCGGGGGAVEDEVVDLELSVPTGFERRLDLLSGKTFLTPRHPSVQDGRHHHDLNLPPPAVAAAAPAASTAVCTLDMVRSALERAAAGRAAASPATSSTSSASTSSSSSSAGKRNRSPPTTATPAMRAAACPSCLTYVLIAEADPRCPRCAARVPPLAGKSVSTGAAPGDGSGKKPRIDLNAAADEAE